MAYPKLKQGSIVIRDSGSGGTAVYVCFVGGEWKLYSANAGSADSIFSFLDGDGVTRYGTIHYAADPSALPLAVAVHVLESKLTTESCLVAIIGSLVDAFVRLGDGFVLRIAYNATATTTNPALTNDDDGATVANRLQASLTGTNAHSYVKTCDRMQWMVGFTGSLPTG